MTAELRRGWCPGVLRPMQTGDGLLVRLRLTGGRFSAATALLIADAARRYGNGHIDLSQRANLQLRGVSADTLEPLTALLGAAGLVDDDERSESSRNVIASPASDFDETAVIDAGDWVGRVERLLVKVAAVKALPAKFGILIDDGGSWPMADVHADIRIEAGAHTPETLFRVGVAGDEATATFIGEFASSDVLRIVEWLCMALPIAEDQGRPKTKDAVERWLAAAGLKAVGGASCKTRVEAEPEYPNAVILHPAFGRLAYPELMEIVARLDRNSRAVLRLTTKKAIVIGPLTAGERRRLQDFGDANPQFVATDDPLYRVQACVGAPACRNGSTDTRADAIKLAPLLPLSNTLHVSGCSKGCASRAAADLVLVAEGGLYRLGRNCKASDLLAEAGRTTLAEIERQMAAFEHEHAYA